VRAIRQILDQAARRDYTVEVHPNALVNTRHNRMAFPPDNTDEYVRSNDSHRLSSKPMVDCGVHQQGVRMCVFRHPITGT